MIPRLMQVYNPPIIGKYITDKAQEPFPIILGNGVVEIPRQDNIETLLRYFSNTSQRSCFLKHSQNNQILNVS